MFGFLFKMSSQKIEAVLRQANALYEQKLFDKAIPLYQKILKSNPAHFAAKANLAVCYFELEQFEEAITWLQNVAAIDSKNPWWQNYLSQAYQKIGRFDEALKSALKAVELSGGANEHHLNMAYTLYEIADEKGERFVRSTLRQWYKKYKKNGIVEQSYRSFYPDKNFAASNLEYVENLFDVFAPDFDAVLTELDYHSPMEIAKVLADFLADKSHKKIKVLDLGCGSGLCGKYIKENLSQSIITGVDISEKMLAEAKNKNIYDSLVKCDLMSCFGKIKTKYDVVVASDVFTYFGSLETLFLHISKILKSQGVFVFTISSNKMNKKDWFLQVCSRFVHSEKYIKKLLSDNGFEIVGNEEKILRREGEKDVCGRLFTAVLK